MGTNLEFATLIGANLSGANLEYANLENADLQRSDLSGANLSGANLSSANLSGANLSSSKLVGVNFGAANLSNVNFDGANLFRARLGGSNLSKANLSKASLKRVQSGSITGKPLLPKLWKMKDGYVMGPTASLRGSSIVGSLNGIDLSQADLSQVRGRSVSGAPKLPSGWGIRKGVLIGPHARLDNVNLYKTDFRKLNLTGAIFTKSDLRQANMTNVNLSHADLSGANLEGAKLQGASLAYSELEKTKLKNALLGFRRDTRVYGQPKSLPRLCSVDSAPSDENPQYNTLYCWG